MLACNADECPVLLSVSVASKGVHLDIKKPLLQAEEQQEHP